MKLALLTLGTLFAFHAVGQELVRHLAAEPWARYSLVFLPLFAWCVWREGGRVEGSRSGLLWVAAAVTLQALAVAGAEPRSGRHALALAWIGGARLLGLVRLRTALLLLAAIPVPTMMISRTSPALERAWLALAQPWVAEDTLVSLTQRALIHEAGGLRLIHADGGLALAWLMVGLVWYSGIRLSWSARATAAALLAAVPAALALQAGAVVGVAALVGRGPDAETLRCLLTHGPWLAVALGATLVVERHALARGPR